MGNTVSIVTYAVPAENAAELEQRVREHLLPAARLIDGYTGFLLIDQGEGQRMAILSFESVADARAAQQILTPVGEQHTYALMSSPAVGSLGTVLIADGSFG